MSRKPSSKGPSNRVERVQKLLAGAGAGSRRAIEKEIALGHVRLNDRQAELGDTAGDGDRLCLGVQCWQVTRRPLAHRSLVYNKPEGEVTTRSDPQGRPTVFDRLPRLKQGRWIAVGRLDINTTGLLLLTTDGELANAMMHPSNEVDREYACRILGKVDPMMIQRLKSGVELEDGPAHFSDIVDSGGEGENRWFHVTLMEGRNREVRRLWASQGVRVSRLKRVRYGAAFLPKRLRMGAWHEFSAQDHCVLREDVGLSSHAQGLQLKPIGRARKSTGKRRR